MNGEVRAEALNLSVEDERVARLTEPRLRHLVGLQPAEQLRQFRPFLDATEPNEASSIRLPVARVPTFSAFLAEFRPDVGGWAETTWRGLSGVLKKSFFPDISGA